MEADRRIGLAVVALGAVVLVGWAIRSRPLVTMLPGAVAMQPNTALGFVLAGASVWRRHGREALGASLLGAAALAEYAGVGVGASTWICDPAWASQGASAPGLMSPATALAFVAAGGLVSRSHRVSVMVGVLLAGLGGVSLLGYTTGVVAAYDIYEPFTAMALHTAIGCVALSAAATLRSASHTRLGLSGVLAVALGLSALGLATATAQPIVVGYALAFAGAIGAVAHYRQRAVSAAAMRAREEELAREAAAHHAEFVGVICHDIRAPLNHVIQLASLLERGAAKIEDVKRAAHAAHRAIQHIERVYGALDGGRGPITVRSLIVDVLDAYQADLAERGVTIVLEGEAHSVPEICRTVLLNLIGNAIKYGGERPLVRVSASHESGWSTVRVSDSGRGFTAEVGARIFDPFYRAHDSQPGTGLGLSFCRQIVDQLGGRIWADSAGPNKGATFTFQVPCSAPAAGALPHSP